MKLRTNKKGTLIATVDGVEYDICEKGEHNLESIDKMCDQLHHLAVIENNIKAAEKLLAAAREGQPIPSVSGNNTPKEMVDCDNEPDVQCEGDACAPEF